MNDERKSVQRKTIVILMKKIITIILCLVLCFATLGVPALADDDYFISFDTGYGAIVESEVEPFLQKGRTFMPIRYFADAFRIYMTWDESEQTATLERLKTTVCFTVGSDTITITKNDMTSSVKMGVTPIIVDGIVCVPIRFVAEAFDLTVEWSEWRKGQENDEDWFASSGTSGFFSISEKTSIRQVTIQETVPEMWKTTFFIAIGISEMIVGNGAFHAFVENDHFRFAYSRFVHHKTYGEDGSVSFQPYIGSIDADPEGNSIRVATPISIGPRLLIVSATCEAATGTSFADMHLESVVSHISALYMTEKAEIDYEYSTFNGNRCIYYNFRSVIDREVYSVAGIALFRNGLLMRFEVCEIFPEEFGENEFGSFAVSKDRSNPIRDYLLLSLVIKQ